MLSVAWSPDGRRLACGSMDGTISVFDVARAKFLHHLKGHFMPVLSVIYALKSYASRLLNNRIKPHTICSADWFAIYAVNGHTVCSCVQRPSVGIASLIYRGSWVVIVQGHWGIHIEMDSSAHFVQFSMHVHLFFYINIQYLS